MVPVLLAGDSDGRIRVVVVAAAAVAAAAAVVTEKDDCECC
jgi:hypothetical protein